MNKKPYLMYFLATNMLIDKMKQWYIRSTQLLVAKIILTLNKYKKNFISWLEIQKMFWIELCFVCSEIRDLHYLFINAPDEVKIACHQITMHWFNAIKWYLIILQLVNFIHFSNYQIFFSIWNQWIVWMKYWNIYLLIWYSVKFKGYVGICMDSSGDKLLIRRDEQYL